MRMWNVPPEVMCQKHLCGEHVEMHMLVGTILKGISIRGYVAGGLVETARIAERHELLSREMTRRGYRHLSPLPAFSTPAAGAVDRAANLVELARRCPACEKRQKDGALLDKAGIMASS